MSCQLPSWELKEAEPVLRTWYDPERALVWYALDGFGARVGVPDGVLVAARDPHRVIVEALCALRDELCGAAGEKLLGRGDFGLLGPGGAP